MVTYGNFIGIQELLNYIYNEMNHNDNLTSIKNKQKEEELQNYKKVTVIVKCDRDSSISAKFASAYSSLFTPQELEEEFKSRFQGRVSSEINNRYSDTFVKSSWKTNTPSVNIDVKTLDVLLDNEKGVIIGNVRPGDTMEFETIINKNDHQNIDKIIGDKVYIRYNNLTKNDWEIMNSGTQVGWISDFMFSGTIISID